MSLDGTDDDLERALEALDGELDDRARTAARRLGDRRLRDQLAAVGFAGPLYQVFELEAAAYGIGVFMKWLRTGEAYARAAAKRRVVPRPKRELTLDERRGLTHLIVAFGLAFFRQEAFWEGRWNPEGGASLRTFFIGACLLQFKAAVEAWRPDLVAAEQTTDRIDEVAGWMGGAAPDAAGQALTHLRAWGVVEQVDDATTRAILVCTAAGLTHQQTAEVIGGGLTAGSVGARIARLRRKYQQTRAKEGRS